MSMIDDVGSQKAQLLDVRTVEEWEGGHAEHALHIPIDELLKDETSLLQPAQTIYVYCASGGRAGTATKYLQERSFRAKNIGGLKDWIRAGGTLAKKF